jgi:dihydrofolate synthase/folylpolyglutamate synthase
MEETNNQYQQTLDYLYSFVDYSLQHIFRYSPEKFNLERMREFVKILGNPQAQYPTIHIAGTKGKGSVAALCASALQAAGYTVGLYTSPHLDDYAERIQVDRQNIPHDYLSTLVQEIKPQIESIPELTTFEITTGLAFVYFARKQVDVAVIEVGLGGRLDATNVITPLVSVITSLSYDHTQLLGETLSKIAFEKAGIIKPGIPVVVYPLVEEANEVIERVAIERGSKLVLVGDDYQVEVIRHSLDGQVVQVWEKPEAGYKPSPTRLEIPLLGHHQVLNAATAYAALRTVGNNRLKINEAAIVKGFAHVFWPARFEVLQREPPVVLDCAHNRDSALNLRLTLDEYYPGRPIVLLFGASEDKDIQGMFAELLPRVQELIAVKSFHPRAIDPQILIELAQPYHVPVHIIPEVVEAFVEAQRLANNEALVLVTGSIFVAAAVRIAWKNHQTK